MASVNWETDSIIYLAIAYESVHMNILAGVLFDWFCEISNTARRVLENLQQHSTGSVFTVKGQHPAMA